jgi:hypothetical protein
MLELAPVAATFTSLPGARCLRSKSAARFSRSPTRRGAVLGAGNDRRPHVDETACGTVAVPRFSWISARRVLVAQTRYDRSLRVLAIRGVVATLWSRRALPTITYSERRYAGSVNPVVRCPWRDATSVHIGCRHLDSSCNEALKSVADNVLNIRTLRWVGREFTARHLVGATPACSRRG